MLSQAIMLNISEYSHTFSDYRLKLNSKRDENTIVFVILDV